MNSLGIHSASARQRARETKHLRYGDTLWARKHRVILREHLGAFATPSPSLAAVLTRCGLGALPGEVGAFTEQFTPRLPDGVWERIGHFVRDAVMLASPQTAYSVEILLTAAAHYVAWCLNQGWPLEAETIWSRQAIDLYVTDQYSHLAEGTRRNYRARLMRVSEVVLPEEHGEKMTALNRKSTAAPYSAGQMVRHREWAAAQTSPFKRYRAMLMLVLAAGAGLKANEIADLPADHVQPTSDGGYLITVTGTGVTARTVPLLADWDEWMTAVLENVPADHAVLWGPPNRTRGNAVLSSFTQYTTGDAPRGDRLRATWLVTHLTAGVPIKALSIAAGVRKFEHLPRLLAYVPDLPHAEYVDVLRGAAIR